MLILMSKYKLLISLLTTSLYYMTNIFCFVLTLQYSTAQNYFIFKLIFLVLDYFLILVPCCLLHVQNPFLVTLFSIHITELWLSLVFYYYLFCFVFFFFILFIFLHSNESLFWVISLPFKASTNISNENMDVGKNSKWACTQCCVWHLAELLKNLVQLMIYLIHMLNLYEDTHPRRHTSELQIRGGIEDNSKIIFLISHWKYTLWPLIRIVSARRLWKGVTISVFTEQ